MWDIVMSVARSYLLPLAVEVFNKVRGVPKDVADIEEELKRIQTFINDADKEAASDETNDDIQEKLKQLREAAFCIEDIIDEYMICDEKNPLDPGCAALPCEPVDFIKSLILRLQIANKIHDVKSLVQGIEGKDGLQSRFPLEQRPSSSRGNPNVIWQNLRLEPLFTKETEVVGIDGPKDKLKDWLTKGRKQCTVISVVGMGGLGKTTLAKQVFDNKEIVGHFDCHAWITVSQSYTVEGLLKDMLTELCKDKKKNPPLNISTMDETWLRNEVRRHLDKERYVIVFDDVWNDYFWHEIKFALVENNQSSRILITTRYDRVVECCVKNSSFQVHVHKMERLSDEKSLELFYKKAFRSDSNEHCPEQLVDGEVLRNDSNGCCPGELVDISLEIVKKCDGLPLAIVVIGGLLFRKGEDEWKMFCQDLSLELESNPELDSIKKILSLSYNDLSYNFKYCLLYFGMYPEDYEVKSNRLIRQWIAEGFVKVKEGKTSKEVAQQCLAELINRSLVQVSSFTIDGKAKSCRVHDLVRTMILGKIKDMGFCQFVGGHQHDQSMSSGISRVIIGEQDQSVSSGIIRRLTIASSSNDLVGGIESSHIRSILFITDKISEQFINKIPAEYMPLKVLDFENTRLYCVPENLGNLIHLKYLSFRNTRVKSLPKSIGKLQNLETLDVRQTSVLEMPKEITKLRKLRHLLANMIYSFHLKDSLGGMIALQKISTLIVDYDGVVIGELGKLKQLRDLSITNFRGEHGNTLCSSIHKMQLLEKLYVDTDDDNEVIDLHIMSFPSTIRRLCLRGKLKKFPNWIPGLKNLVKLSLMCSSLTDDPLESLKDLSSLLFLSISHRAYEGETLHFENRGFRRLKELELKYLYNLKSIIIDRGALQYLEKLQLSEIPQLKTVPSGIQDLKKLEVLNIWFMSSEFEQSIAPNGGQEHWIFQHVPRVILLAGLV